MDLLAEIQLKIEALTREQQPFDEVEDLIEETRGLSNDEQAALWLYAWSLMPRRRQLAEARVHLEMVRD